MDTEALSIWERDFTTNQLLTSFVRTLRHITGRMDRSTRDISVPRSPCLPHWGLRSVHGWHLEACRKSLVHCSGRAGGLYSGSTQASELILDTFEIYVMIVAFRVKHISEEIWLLGKCTFMHMWLHLGSYLDTYSRKWMEDLPPQCLMPAAFLSSNNVPPGYWYQPVIVSAPSPPSTGPTLQQAKSLYSCSVSHPKSRTALSSDTGLFSTEWKGT